MNRLLIALALLPVALVNAEPRTFTSPDGRTLEAEISAATPDRVTLKMTNGQTIVAPVDKFVPADQEHIAEWRKANPMQVKYRFAADYSKSKASSSKSGSGSEVITTEMWECNMKLTNQSGQTLDGVTVDYTIYLDEFSRGSKITTSKKGQFKVGTMKNLQQMVVKTDPVQIQGVELKGGYYYTDGSRPRDKESIRGMLIEINHEGKKVFTWASNNVPKGAMTAEGSEGSLFGK
ncbi:MAG: hypothetical protein V4662_05870 [Verrucomicrobiota bacterium]